MDLTNQHCHFLDDAEACYLMRDRFQPVEVYENLGLPADECVAYALESEASECTNIVTFRPCARAPSGSNGWAATAASVAASLMNLRRESPRRAGSLVSYFIGFSSLASHS